VHNRVHHSVRKYRLRASIFITVANSTRTIGIVIASAIALGCMVIAVLISGPLPFHWLRANATSTHDLLVQYAAKDTDTDGLPDWQEGLYGSDPANPNSIRSDLTDAEAIAQGLVKPKFATATSTPIDTASIPGTDSGPETITDRFARKLFEEYLSQAGAAQPTPEQIASFVEQGVKDLTENQAVPDSFSKNQVNVSGSGPEALRAYAVALETALAARTVMINKSEVEYFSDAVQRDDAEALAQVKRIGEMYTATAKTYVAVPVPLEAAGPHLAVANAFARLGVDISDLATMKSDPLRAYFGLAKYQQDALLLISALDALHKVYESEQVGISEGEPGSLFFATLTQAAQAAARL
jgi:hypothetical protein